MQPDWLQGRSVTSTFGVRTIAVVSPCSRVQHLTLKLAHYASEMDDAYSTDPPPGETVYSYRGQQAQERGRIEGQHHCTLL